MGTTQTLVLEICPTTTQDWIKKGALLVDVREKAEIEQIAFDVPNIVNIPLSEFEIRYKELPLGKDIVVVCRSGTRSLRATGFLINHGYDTGKVVNMKHGLIRWFKKGFPTKGDNSSLLGTDSNTACCDSTKNDGTVCC